MGLKMRMSTLFGVFMLFMLIQADAHVHNQPLMCYECEDCEKVSKDTPTKACNEEYFNSGGTTLSSTMTTSTTEEPTPETSNVDDTTTTVETTESTTHSISTETTEEPMPSPPTIGPVPTTTEVPTPPAEGTVVPIPSNDFVNGSQNTANSTTSSSTTVSSTTPTPIPSTTDAETTSTSTERVIPRVRRESENLTEWNPNYTYHCYNVKKTNATGSIVTERGCSRVTTDQAVCTLLEQQQSNGTKLDKCNPCLKSLCNGSAGVVEVSLVTVFIGVVAALLHYN